MKKSILFIAITLFAFSFSFGQSEESKTESMDLKEQFLQMEEEMQKAFGENGQFQILIDTVMTQDFEQIFDPNNFQQFNSENMAESFEQMFKIFEEQFNSFSQEDMQEFEKLLEGFHMDDLIVPAPLDENGNPIPPTEQKKKKEKKRKTYKL